MFDPTSRYYNLENARLTTTDRDGKQRQSSYKKRRFIPDTREATLLTEHSVRQEERLDQVTARYLGDPTQFWRVADANSALDPVDLTSKPGRPVKITVPQL